MKIIQFEKLEPPVYVDVGENNIELKAGWRIPVVGESRYYTLHTDGMTKWLHDFTTTVVFDTEIDAHEVAASYYWLHGKAYPHGKEWLVARTRDTESNVLVNVIESKEMRFK